MAGLGFVKSPITDTLAALHGTTTVSVHPTKGLTVSHVPGVAALPNPKVGQKPPVKTLPTTPGATPPVHPLGSGASAAPPKPAAKSAAKQAAPKPGIPDLSPTQNNPKPKAKAPGAPAAPPSDTATATDTINSILAPIIKEIQDAEDARAAAGQQAIGGYTQNAEDQLKGIDFAAPFAGAAGGENAINTALLARLGGQGSALQDELQGKLGGVDSGLASAIGGNAGATATGAANAGLATGDATTSSLLSQGANAAAYGKKLPAITSLAGAQDTGKLQGQVASDEKTQLGDIQAKVPGMVQSELTVLSNARSAAEKNRIAVALAENIDPNTGQLNAKGHAELKRIQIEQQNANTSATRASISQQNANTAAERATNSQANADRNYQIAKQRLDKSQQPKASASLSKSLGYLVDTAGNPILKDGKRVTLPKSATTAKQTATEQRHEAEALGAARIYHSTWKDSKGDEHKPLSWQQYLNAGLSKGISAATLITQGKKIYSQAEIHQGLIPAG